MAVFVDHRKVARIIRIYRVVGEGDPIAGRRESDVADEPGRLIEDLSKRELETLTAANPPHQREISAVWRPLCLADVLDHHPRRAAQHGGSRKGALAHPAPVRMIQRDRQLSGFRDRQEARVRQSEEHTSELQSLAYLV